MGAVLPLIFGPEAPRAILEDAERAPIPELHRAMFRFVRILTRASWEMTPDELERLRGHGLSDADLVNWAQIASLQGWWTMSADGGGIPLEGEAITGPILKKPRAWYEASPEGLTAAAPEDARPAAAPRSDGSCWVATDESSDAFQHAAAWAEHRYGCVPELFRAVSLRPEVLPRHVLALELLEGPRTEHITPRQHALVRALVSCLNRSPASAVTTRALLERSTGEHDLFERVAADYRSGDWSPDERLVLDFAAKLVRNAYKVTEKDALSFREAGLGDEGYLEVLNTAAIQTSLDRLANALGVAPDEKPLLP